MANGCHTKTATPCRRKQIMRTCMMKDMRRDHTLACQKMLMETEDTRQGSTDAGLLTWKELLHSGRANGKTVSTNYNVASIDVGATLPGRDELRWRDIAIRRPTAATNVQGAAHHGGCAVLNNNRHTDEKSALGQ